MSEQFDVVVVGGGNAGLSAALAAAERGASVCLVEKAPEAWAGGNSWFTAGAFRTSFDSLDDLRRLIDLTDDQAARVEVPPYPADAYFEDLQRITGGCSEPTLGRVLAEDAFDAAAWLAGHGVTWELLFARQSFVDDGLARFWGNLVMGAVGGGGGLVEAELAAAHRSGIEIRFDTAASGLLLEDGAVRGVRCTTPDGELVLEAGGVVLAAGGFEANAERRAQHLGAGWDQARVRGTPYNTGEVLFMALDAGAEPFGDWGHCHAIAWDAFAGSHGDRALGNRLSRQGYPYGLVVNENGHRFLDEGADFRNYTYAKYGAEILRQPGGIAYQLFDSRMLEHIYHVDYDTADASRFTAGTVADLATAMGVDPVALESTIDAYNAAVQPGPFDPARKDGKHTEGLEPPKSNWALPFAEPPFVAYAVGCGITFTFGGVRIDPDGRVLQPGGAPLPGLFACGELVGGLFYDNYPGGTGLAAGTVFGRRAGWSAAASRGSTVEAGVRTGSGSSV